VAEGSAVPAGERRTMRNTGSDRGVGGDDRILENRAAAVAAAADDLGRGRGTS
jgi:hypothetical protein